MQKEKDRRVAAAELVRQGQRQQERILGKKRREVVPGEADPRGGVLELGEADLPAPGRLLAALDNPVGKICGAIPDTIGDGEGLDTVLTDPTEAAGFGGLDAACIAVSSRLARPVSIERPSRSALSFAPESPAAAATVDRRCVEDSPLKVPRNWATVISGSRISSRRIRWPNFSEPYQCGGTGAAEGHLSMPSAIDAISRSPMIGSSSSSTYPVKSRRWNRQCGFSAPKSMIRFRSR